MTRITITTDTDSIRLDDHYRNPFHVWAIKKNGITGILGTPAVRETTTDIPQMDGAYWPSRLTQKPRSISLDCFIKGLSSVETAQARDRINALTGRTLDITIEDASGLRTLTGYLTADPEPLMRFREQAFEFGLVITCPDPFKYGRPQTFAASYGVIRAVNEGNAATWPLIQVTGHATTLHLKCGDTGEIRWEGDTGDLTLDMRDMIPSAGRITLDHAFPIPPGTHDVTVQTNTGAAVTLTLRPAWR